MPQVVEKDIVYRGRLTIEKRKIRHSSGGVQHYEIVNPESHSVAVVAFDTDQNVILVELYRFGQNKRLIELPAGGLNTGESPSDAIARELLEETGYCGELQKIGEHYIASESGVTRHVFIAKNCQKVAEPKPEQSEIDEELKVVKLPIRKFVELVRSGQLTETGAGYMALDSLGLLTDHNR